MMSMAVEVSWFQIWVAVQVGLADLISPQTPAAYGVAQEVPLKKGS